MEKAVSNLVDFAIWYLGKCVNPTLTIGPGGSSNIYTVVIRHDGDRLCIRYVEDEDKYQFRRFVFENSKGKIIDENVLTLDELKHYVTEAF